jgi:hypothetical protein
MGSMKSGKGQERDYKYEYTWISVALMDFRGWYEV